MVDFDPDRHPPRVDAVVEADDGGRWLFDGQYWAASSGHCLFRWDSGEGRAITRLWAEAGKRVDAAVEQRAVLVLDFRVTHSGDFEQVLQELRARGDLETASGVTVHCVHAAVGEHAEQVLQMAYDREAARADDDPRG